MRWQIDWYGTRGGAENRLLCTVSSKNSNICNVNYTHIHYTYPIKKHVHCTHNKSEPKRKNEKGTESGMGRTITLIENNFNNLQNV